ncbi:MAG: ATP-binding protein [Gemmatimonadetes bacterium]|nr:ATP-binding protein [Gemmatimonadota bacterium]NIQ54421.1 ATP-binding protein [Gemmatimonadota bacterium]NIU74631.1 ATP-binding protein [Gammaproteobacteria bacterium]NIX44562.1 ATP-binding protein [Gemmatimonadota bacterium]NIY08775.1 ATP-binding protein [Gemmatimonadota bacterium]
MESRHQLELPNDLGAIERSVDYLLDRCRAVGFDESRLRLNFRVGVAEALANAMMYGNARDPGKSVTLEIWCSPERVRIRITDEGSGFDPGTLPDPTLPQNRTRSRGRGVFLIRQLMDEVEFNEQGNSIEMVLWAEGDPPDREVAS